MLTIVLVLGLLAIPVCFEMATRHDGPNALLSDETMAEIRRRLASRPTSLSPRCASRLSCAT